MVNKPQEYKSPYVDVRPRKSERTCLRCNESFSSTGPGNRICGECARKNIHEYRRDTVRTFGLSSSAGLVEGKTNG